MTLSHFPGDPLFCNASKFDIWMEQEGYKIILDIVNSPKDICYACHTRRQITEHHIIPIHRGGSNLFYNLVPLCELHHKEAHEHNRDQKTDKEWILLIKKMRDRNIYKGSNSNSNNKEEINYD